MKTAISHILKGLAMGIAETIPGVSGGTIAFISGIYERLLNSITAFGGPAWGALRREGFGAFWRSVDGRFLAMLFTGMALGILVGVFGLSYLLAHYPLQVWGFFFGLIAASVWYVGKQVGRWRVAEVLAVLAAAALAYWITVASPAQGNTSLLYVFVCGMVAISAMMLPGISGSFMLLLMGMYQFILHDSLKEGVLQEFSMGSAVVIAVFGAGCLVGVMTFAKVLKWLFDHYHNLTMAALTGFMLGSLNRVWPWQQVLETRLNSDGEEQVFLTQSVWPSTFAQLQDNFLYGNAPQLLPVLLCMVAGLALVLLLERNGKEATS